MSWIANIPPVAQVTGLLAIGGLIWQVRALARDVREMARDLRKLAEWRAGTDEKIRALTQEEMRAPRARKVTSS